MRRWRCIAMLGAMWWLGASCAAQSLTLTTESIPAGEVDAPYPFTFTASGGVPPYGFRIDTLFGNLNGLGLIYPTGQVVGTPDYPGTYTLPVTVRDSTDTVVRKEFTLVVHPGVLRFEAETLPAVLQGNYYSTTIRALGGTRPRTFAMAGGTLPSGLSFATQGSEPNHEAIIFGSTTAIGSYPISIRVTDSAVPPQVTTHEFVLEVIPPPPLTFWTTKLADAVTGRYYRGDIEWSGGAPPYTLTSSNLPAGLAIEYGAVTGTAPAAGNYQIDFDLRDSLGNQTSTSLPLKVVLPVAVTTLRLPDAYMGESYKATLQATGGTPPYTWSSSLLPAEWTLNPATGEVSGLAGTNPGEHRFIAGATDSSDPQFNGGAWVEYTLRESRMAVVTQSLPGAGLGAGYHAQLEVAGGSAPHTWSITSGRLPEGLTLNSVTGVISGTAIEAGRFTMTLQAQDSMVRPDNAARMFRLHVGESPGRNNTIATATPLRDGRYRASISPINSGSTVAPDVDVYAITVQRGQTLRVETFAHRMVYGSALNSVLEIVDANGNRLMNCSVSGTTFNSPCMSDDVDGTGDSRLFLNLPGTGTQAVYARVLDWRGDARPDLVYEIEVAGAAAPPAPPLGTPRKTPRTR